jgi:DNA mismatch repair protein MutL
VNEAGSVYRHPTFPVLDVVGQLHGRYIVASDPETLYFIDQHAAKERINFEALIDQLDQHVSTTQELLVPLTVPLKPSFIPKIPDFLTALATIGLEAERFSETHLVVRRVPLWLKEGTQEAFMAELVERFDEEKTLSLASLRHAALATTACHKSIRFNQQLTPTELRHIVDELSHCQQPYHCPHGRPTLIKINAEDLWKDFDR